MTETKILTKFWDLVDPMSLESYRRKGGYKALQQVLRELKPEQVRTEIKASGLQGRGGAGFLTGEKWEIAAQVSSDERFFICNLDESEPGTFKDMMLAEKNPHQLIEGMLIACYAIGAKKACIYLNGKFRQAKLILQTAIQQAYAENLLGKSILGMAFDVDLEIFQGAGAYICGEESALINSMEGRRGEPRIKPPFPCNCGLAGKPTVVNNAETVANLPWIIRNGAAKFAAIGLRQSPGTKLFCLDGAIKKPGIYEVPLGISVGDLINQYGQGMREGCQFWFAQVGGSSGRIVTAAQLAEIPSFAKDATIPLGSGAVLVSDKFQDAKKYLLSLMNFFQRESCGQCVPCREGTFRLREIIERLANGNINQDDKNDIEKLVWVLDNTTFCPLGKFSVTALKDLLKYKIIQELAS